MADLATCADCLREILDPADRRFGYAFTSCMHCGPRYCIIEALPYDRARTTMRHFPLCAACQAEYTDPRLPPVPCRADRLSRLRPAAGVLERRRGGNRHRPGGARGKRPSALRRGMIVALKGLGGFQLLVDAGNEAAVLRLRQRKRRPAQTVRADGRRRWRPRKGWRMSGRPNAACWSRPKRRSCCCARVPIILELPPPSRRTILASV